jgi:hypothetical protein
MRGLTRLKVLVAMYILVLIAALVMSALDVLGLLPLLLIIGAAGGLLHLACVMSFASLPDYLHELKGDGERPRGRS